MSQIPLMTNPLGKYWDQPKNTEIEVDEKSALMVESSFNKLSEYSHSMPSGVYEGKMWKSKTLDGWVLRWYQSIPNNDDEMDIMARKIVIV